MGIVAWGTVLVSRLRHCGRAAWRWENGEGAPTGDHRRGARAAVKPCSEGAWRARHAAVPWVQADRVSLLSQAHGVNAHRIMTSQSAEARGAHLGAPWGTRWAAAGAAPVVEHHSAAIA